MNFEIFTVDARAVLSSADSVLANLIIDGEITRPTVAAGEDWAARRACDVYENPRDGEHRGVVVLTDDTRKWWVMVQGEGAGKVHVRTIKGDCPVDLALEQRAKGGKTSLDADVAEAYRLLTHLHHRGALGDLPPGRYQQVLALIERLRLRVLE